MRAVWVAIGVMMAVTCAAAFVMDCKGDEESAEMWGLAMLALCLAAGLLYGWQYRPMAPSAPRAREAPIVYDRTVSDRQPLDTMD